MPFCKLLMFVNNDLNENWYENHVRTMKKSTESNKHCFGVAVITTGGTVFVVVVWVTIVVVVDGMVDVDVVMVIVVLVVFCPLHRSSEQHLTDRSRLPTIPSHTYLTRKQEHCMRVHCTGVGA